jgi:hypothetical protein
VFSVSVSGLASQALSETQRRKVSVTGDGLMACDPSIYAGYLGLYSGNTREVP